MVVPRIPASRQCQTDLTFPSSSAHFLLKAKQERTTHIFPIFFFRISKTQPMVLDNAGTRCIPGKPEIWPPRSENGSWSYGGILVVHSQLPRHVGPALQKQEKRGRGAVPSTPALQLLLPQGEPLPWALHTPKRNLPPAHKISQS